MATKSLPPHLHLDHLKNQAKALLKAHKAGVLDACVRIKAFHPRFSTASEAEILRSRFTLSGAQLVIAREYGFTSWPKLKQHVESLTGGGAADEVEQFKKAVYAEDADKVRDLFRQHPSLTARINDPLFHFDAPAIVIAASSHSHALIDVLLEHGADINAKSQWWAGSYGVLHGHALEHPDQAAHLIERGAVVDIHAAAGLGMMDRLEELITADPSLVNAKGPDGQRPLHFAGTPEVIDFLLAHGADINARDVDHGSTPAQYAINNPDICRYLIQRGAEPDIFIACALGDVELARRCLEADPHCLHARLREGEFTSGDSEGGHIYLYKLGATGRPLVLAAERGHRDVVNLLLPHGTIADRFLVACWQADDAAAQSILAEHPDIVRSLSREDMALIFYAAWENKLDTVRVMLNAGFDVAARGMHGGTALHIAAWNGLVEMVNLLLEHNAPVDLTDEDFRSTPLGWAAHGSVHRHNAEGDYPAVVEALISAGASLDDVSLPTGNKEIDDILRRHGKTE